MIYKHNDTTKERSRFTTNIFKKEYRMKDKYRRQKLFGNKKLTVCISSEKECISYSNNIVYIQVKLHTTIERKTHFSSSINSANSL